MQKIVHLSILCALLVLLLPTTGCRPKDNPQTASTITLTVRSTHVNGHYLAGGDKATPYMENSWSKTGARFKVYFIQDGLISAAGDVVSEESSISDADKKNPVTVKIPVPQDISTDRKYKIILVDYGANSEKGGDAIECEAPLKRGIGRIFSWYMAEAGAGYTSRPEAMYLTSSEGLYIKNATDATIKVKHKGYSAREKWYFTDATVKLVADPYVHTVAEAKASGAERESSEIEIAPGQTGFILSSFAPNGNKMTNASLVLEIDGKEFQTEPASSDIEIENGTPYFLNVTWNGTNLVWGSDSAVPEPEGNITVRNYQKEEGDTVVDMGEQTVFVQSDINSTIQSYDEQAGIISFETTETLSDLGLKVGDYLYSNEQTQEFPDGYCFRITDVRTRSTKGPYTTDYIVEEANILEAIDYYKDKIDIAWDKVDVSNISVYDIINMPDLETAGNLILGPEAFSKKSIGGGLSITPGIRKTVLEYVIWQSDGKSEAGYGDVKHADMKLVIEATIDHDLYNGITFELDHGKILFDTDLECGISLSLKFKIDGKNFNKEEMTKEDRKEFLKEFERSGSRAIGRQVQICSIDLPMGAATVILRPKFEILWDFRVEKIAGEFEFTVGYVGAKYNMHFENTMPWSTNLVGEPLTCIQQPEWIMKFEGEIEGTVATGPAIGITVEIPGLRYSGEYKNVRKWKNYKGRTIPAFVGAYLELLLEGSFKLQSSYDVLTSKLLTQVILSSKLRLDAFEEHLIGFGKLLVGHDQKRAGLFEWNLGDATYELFESNAQEYCASPKVGSYIPEGESVLLEWGSTRANASSLVYDVYLGADEKSLSAVKESNADTWYRVSASKPGKYYWKVVAITPSGQRYESDIWFFTIGDPPGQENVILPIDLGLPSGLTWGDRNLGADKNSDPGLYYSWGSTTNVTGTAFWNNYKWIDYRWAVGSEVVMTKYNQTDMLTILERDDDAAAVNSERQGWRMPTREEWQELLDNCTWTLSERNGVPGYVVKNEWTEAFVFIPIITRYIGQDENVSSQGGIYWTSSRSILNNVSLANAVEISSSDKLINKVEPRYYGFMVRPVFDGNAAPSLAADQTTMDFGGVAFDTSKSMHLTITNVGYSILYLEATSITAPFSCDKYQESISLEPGHACVFTVQFSPETLTDYEGKLLISSNSPGGVTSILLKGKGISKSNGDIDDIPGTNL